MSIEYVAILKEHEKINFYDLFERLIRHDNGDAISSNKENTELFFENADHCFIVDVKGKEILTKDYVNFSFDESRFSFSADFDRSIFYLTSYASRSENNLNDLLLLLEEEINCFVYIETN